MAGSFNDLLIVFDRVPESCIVKIHVNETNVGVPLNSYMAHEALTAIVNSNLDEPTY